MNGDSDEKLNVHGDKINGHGDKMNGHVHEKMNGCGANGVKMNGHHDTSVQKAKANGVVPNGNARNIEADNLKNSHRMDLGSPKIPMVALKI